jgi:hypothetical protein
LNRFGGPLRLRKRGSTLVTGHQARTIDIVDSA